MRAAFHAEDTGMGGARAEPAPPRVARPGEAST